MAEDERVVTKESSDFTRSRISQLTTFISWTYYQQEEGNEKFYLMHCFTTDNIQKYFNFQLNNLGKDELVQASYFRNMFEAFYYVANKLQTWIPTLELVQCDRDFFLNVNAETVKWLQENITNVNFKEKIWTNIAKQAQYLKEAGLTLTKEDFKLVEKTCVETIQLFHKVWLAMHLQPEEREQLWNTRGYHVMESQCWLILLHLWLFGIRPSSLLQVRKDNFMCQFKEPLNFTLSFKFFGNDKSQYGGVDRRLGFTKLVEEFLYFAYARLPVAHKFYGREEDCPVLFLSYTGQSLHKDALTLVFKRMYGMIINKYTFPRMIRFWLGHYGYEAAKGDEEKLMTMCYLWNHSIHTHLKYYVLTDHIVQHDPKNDTDFFDQMLQ